jgi:hypothetical protein
MHITRGAGGSLLVKMSRSVSSLNTFELDCLYPHIKLGGTESGLTCSRSTNELYNNNKP